MTRSKRPVDLTHALARTRHSRVAKGRAARRGLTLLELLLALAGTAVVGTAVAMLITGIVYGTKADKDLRELITRQMALNSRLQAEVRESRLLLDAGADYMILWSVDTNGDGLPAKTEIQIIEYDAATDTILRYAPADGIVDSVYALTDDFRTTTNVYKGDATFPAETWGQEVTSLTLSLDDVDPQSARLVSYRIGMSGGDVPDTAIGAAALRNEASP